MSSKTRIRLQFNNSKFADAKGEWYLINHDQCQLVGDLIELIRAKYFDGKPVDLELLLDGYHLPLEESIDLIRENDVVFVKSSGEKSSPIKLRNTEDVGRKSSFNNQSLKMENRPKIKPAKRFSYCNGAEFRQPLTKYSPYVYLSKIGKLNEYPQLYVGSTDALNETHVATLIEQMEKMKNKKAVGKTGNTAKRSTPFKTERIPEKPNFKEADVSAILQSYTTEPLTSIPTVGSLIAYKIMKVSQETYLPEASEVSIAKIIDIDQQGHILRLELLNPLAIPNIHSKFQRRLQSILVDWNSLMEVKLLKL